MLTLASPIVNLSALWRIILAALAGGAGVAIAFGLLLLGVSHARRARTAAARGADYLMAVVAGAFCVAAVAIGVYAMTQKTSSSKPTHAKSALTAPPRGRVA